MKKKVAAVVCMTILAVSLASCGNNETSAKNEKKQAADTESEGETLTVWTWDPNFNMYAIEKAAEIYREAGHEGFSVEITEVSSTDVETKLITAAESGELSTLPDVFMLRDESFEKFVKNYPELFYDLTDSGIVFSEFAPAKTAYSTVEGKNMGIPFDSGTVINCVRTDILEEAGFTVDDFTDITWTEFIEKAEVVKEKTGLPMLCQQAGEPSLIMMMLQSCGASVFQQDGTLNILENNILKECMELYKEMVDKGILLEVTAWDQYVSALNNGSVAGCCNGCWVIGSITAAEDQKGKWAVTNIPRLDDTEGAVNYSNNGGSSWVISSQCKDPELAVDFFKTTFAGSMELYDDVLSKGVLSSWKNAGESDVYNQELTFFQNDAVYKKIVDYSGKVPLNISGQYYFDAANAIGVGLTNYIQRDENLNDIIQSINDELTFIIDSSEN